MEIENQTDVLVENEERQSGSEESSQSEYVVSDSYPRKLHQYAATIIATLSAMTAGIILGWTSPIKSVIENGDYNNIKVDDVQMGWIGSLTNVGALLACIPTGFLCDKFGRKTMLCLLVIPFTVGWILIIFANNVEMLYSGRFICGIGVGGCCVAAPMYVSEIAHKEIRGTLGSYFQLMVTIGVLYAYIIGATLTTSTYCYLCAIHVLLFATIVWFIPESPLYYLKINDLRKAEAALVILRGENYDNTVEILELDLMITEASVMGGILTAFKRKACRIALFISLSLMLFQQFSGINAIIFYTSDIFSNAGVKLDPRYCSIIVGACQVIATFASSLVVDKLGRRVLLLTSGVVMSVAMFLLSMFFTLKNNKIITDETLNSIGFLPIIFLVIYIIAFSLGFGPIPWMLNGELFSPEIKGIANSISGSFNWFLAFLITRFYLQLDKAIGNDNMFYLFYFALLFAVLFIWFLLPETKGKSTLEIQLELDNY